MKVLRILRGKVRKVTTVLRCVDYLFWIYIGLMTVVVLIIAFSSVPIAFGQEVIWNESGVWIRVPEISAFTFEGIVVNAFYNTSSPNMTLVLIAYNYTSSAVATGATFEVYNYWNGSKIAEVYVDASNSPYNLVVDTNMTIIYVKIGTERFGPYYVSYYPPTVSVPKELEPYVPLFALAILIAFAGRSSLRDVGLGLIAFGLMASIVLTALGFTSPWTPLLGVACIVIGGTLLYVEMSRESS
ncbi:MAG: hypothetical protein DRJ40_11665 [Thermoprotei archaeon]|nr:MAG: hypothetical protein DRJ40_11665 [Thermoprotei archaeon]